MEKNTKEKTCAFYASDYHFEMISLPYIEEKIKNQNEIIILTENNLEESIKTLLEKTNLKEEKKEKILNLNWKNNNLEKLKTIKTKIDQEKDITIFIKGNQNYIKNINQNIEKWVEENQKVKIIDCYNIEEVGKKVEEITGQYQEILKTGRIQNIT